MKRQTDNHSGCRRDYVAPCASVNEAQYQGVLCTSTPDSDFIENMETGDNFSNWI